MFNASYKMEIVIWLPKEWCSAEFGSVRHFPTRTTTPIFEVVQNLEKVVYYGHNNPLIYSDPSGHVAVAAGIYFVPGVGEIALAATGVVAAGYITFTYQGTKLGAVSTAGASLSLSYDGAGKLAAVSDPSNRQMSFGYDPVSGDLTSITDVDGATTRFTYDNSHHVLSVTDPKGTAEMSVTYDDNQRVTSFTDFYGNTSFSAYEGRIAPVGEKSPRTARRGLILRTDGIYRSRMR
ncbi:hypothetical protein [Paenibacillus sp. S150]|uniref:hypothetical protein n=1 Tax=Paenibacillus sp. S150 TaxID=2749826 RepID=UPI001C58CD25|nr:hypothetical protein [Paenibacillus sp. S150]MBW4082934.1 RHS repeat protein [Paenibacillus sp. S150]